MKPGNIRIVLVRPSHPGNIGAAARAMKNMGFARLYLVDPVQFPSETASARASGAEDILDSAHVCDSLDEALSNCHYVITTTARQRSLAWDNLDARTAAAEITNQAIAGEVAVVFGPERTGLSNQEIGRSHCLIHISVDERFSSMNLAAAVMLVCYELRIAAIGVNETVAKNATGEIEKPATADQVEGFVTHLHEIMEAVGFLINKPSDRLMRRIRRVFNRARMSEQDVNLLRGILAGVVSKIKHTGSMKE